MLVDHSFILSDPSCRLCANPIQTLQHGVTSAPPTPSTHPLLSLQESGPPEHLLLLHLALEQNSLMCPDDELGGGPWWWNKL